ncbi:MAG: hypothetical protein C0401_11100 [Anaerolinea sp.]|nr:hypothetical protein [Anaerolinea sp.]
MRLLIILNENPPGSHIDVHNALSKLKQEGALQSYVIFPWLAYFERGIHSQDIAASIAKTAREFEPTAILWAHTAGLRVSTDTINNLRQLPSRPSMGYFEGDLYESPYKPLPTEVLNLAVACDVIFCPGFGVMTDLLKRKGCLDIRYVPSPTDEWRFGRVRDGSEQILFDVVMVGNNVFSRLPWRTMPGSRERRELAKFFQERLGSRFAVFGMGWKAPYAAGPIPFDQQIDLYHRSRIAFGVNNLHAKYSFSNRLPIAMSCGVPMVYGYETGFDEVFEPNCGAFFFKDKWDAWSIIKNLLAKDQTELDEIGEIANRFALSRFTTTHIFRYMCETLAFYAPNNRDRRNHGIPTNPWIRSTCVY